MIPYFNIKKIIERSESKSNDDLLLTTFEKTQRYLPIIYFHGGIGGMEAVAKGLIDERKPIGFVASILSDNIRKYIIQKRPMTFIDTGAFSEMTKGQTINWKSIYSEEAPFFQLGNKAYVVLPDKIDDIEETFQRAFQNKDRILNIYRYGCNLLLPIQSETDPVRFIQDYFKMVTPYPDNLLAKTIPAIPRIFIDKDKENVIDLIKKLVQYGYSKIHLLGAGVSKTEYFAKQFPSIQFYCDSVWTRGKNKSNPLTRFSRSRIQSLITNRPTLFENENTIKLDIVRAIKNKPEYRDWPWERFFGNFFEYRREKQKNPAYLYEHQIPEIPKEMEMEIIENMSETMRTNAERSNIIDNTMLHYWAAFNEDIVQTLPQIEGISRSGRKTGISSYTASYEATRKEVNDLEAEIAETPIQFNGETIKLGVLRNELSLNEQLRAFVFTQTNSTPSEISEIIKNMVTVVFSTGYPFGLVKPKTIQDSPWTTDDFLTMIKTTLNPVVNLKDFADKVKYYEILMSMSSANPSLRKIREAFEKHPSRITIREMIERMSK